MTEFFRVKFNRNIGQKDKVFRTVNKAHSWVEQQMPDEDVTALMATGELWFEPLPMLGE